MFDRRFGLLEFRGIPEDRPLGWTLRTTPQVMLQETHFFLLFALGAIAGSLGVITCRQPVNSAISLVVSFFFLAGTYILLNAQFMAVIQILVYAGAIMVLFLFVLMLLNLADDELGKARLNVTKLGAVFMSSTIMVILMASVRGFSGEGERLWAPTVPEGFGTVEPIGTLLLQEYVLPFEMVSVLLLAGIVGAVVVAKKRL